MEPRFSVDGHRLQIDLSAIIMAEVEIILPDGKRILYTFDAPPTPDLALDSLTGLVRAFLAHKEIDENRAMATLGDYQRRINLFVSWLADHGRDPLRAADWRDYYASLRARGLAALSIRNHYRPETEDRGVYKALCDVNPRLVGFYLKGLSEADRESLWRGEGEVKSYLSDLGDGHDQYGAWTTPDGRLFYFDLNWRAGSVGFWQKEGKPASEVALPAS